MMQANSAGGDMPQYDNSWGSTTWSKDHKACERSDDPKKGGYAQYATLGGQQLDQKVQETYGRSDDPKEEGYAPVCDGEQTGIHNAPKLLCSEICSSVM